MCHVLFSFSQVVLSNEWHEDIRHYFNRRNELHLTSQSHLVDIHLEGIELNLHADVAPGSNIDSLKARDIGSSLKMFTFLRHLHQSRFNLGSKCLHKFSAAMRSSICFDWHVAIASAWGQRRSTQPSKLINSPFLSPYSIYVPHMNLFWSHDENFHLYQSIWIHCSRVQS